MMRAIVTSILTLLFAALPASATLSVAKAPASTMPVELKDIGIREHLGDKLNLNLKFQDENGNWLPLSTYFDGKKPVLLSFVYYGCPNLCSLYLNGVVESLNNISFTPGNQFEMVVISIDPSENHVLAAEKKASYLKEYKKMYTEKGWHFLVGKEKEIKELTTAAGFLYKWNPDTKEWAHASAGIVVGPHGEISRYLHGFSYEERTFRLSMVEASKGLIGTIMDHVTLFCMKFDPKAHKYTFAAFSLMRIAALVTLIFLAMVVIPVWRRNTRQQGVR